MMDRLWRKLLLLITLYVCISPANAAEAPKVDLAQFDYLFESVSLMRQHPLADEMGEAATAQILKTSCGVFSTLLEDDDFVQSVQFFSDKSNYEDLLLDVEQTYLEFDNFLDFLGKEREILLEAGLGERDVDAILALIVAVRSMMTDFDPDAEAILSGLQSTTDEICRASVENIENSGLAWKAVLITFGSALPQPSRIDMHDRHSLYMFTSAQKKRAMRNTRRSSSLLPCAVGRWPTTSEEVWRG